VLGGFSRQRLQGQQKKKATSVENEEDALRIRDEISLSRRCRENCPLVLERPDCVKHAEREEVVEF